MHLVLDILQGVGIAVAVGIRPFLPAFAVGALAAGDVQIDFNGTDFSFLQSAAFLVAAAIAALALGLLERQLGSDGVGRGPVAVVVVGLALALAAVLFAGALAQDHYASWPGLIGGVVCAALGALATRSLLDRVRARLGREGASMVPLYAEAGAFTIAVLSVLAPPVGLVALVLLGWLLLAGRRRGPEKYAGLRILR